MLVLDQEAGVIGLRVQRVEGDHGVGEIERREQGLEDGDLVGLVLRSAGEFQGWGEVVRFEARTATRIGEVSGARVKDIDREAWTWDACRQTTTSPGGLVDKGTKGRSRRTVPIIPEIRPMVARRLDLLGRDPMARLFTGPRGGRSLLPGPPCPHTSVGARSTHPQRLLVPKWSQGAVRGRGCGWSAEGVGGREEAR
ncbi:hypothetical protein [Actinacidiphila sp. bgisy145]|uniref:hypothetical protein n=1 Tax=Actinacidiphila sp. bgisy145 TaxID=3413792 RepID=UPI003EB831ED